MLPEQLVYVHSVSATILNALKRLPTLYLKSPAIRHRLRLDPTRRPGSAIALRPAGRESDPVFGRLDAVVDFTNPMWKNSLQFLEPNLTGVGGIHLVPTCDRIVADVVLPHLRERDAELQLEPCARLSASS